MINIGEKEKKITELILDNKTITDMYTYAASHNIHSFTFVLCCIASEFTNERKKETEKRNGKHKSHNGREIEMKCA